MIPALGGDVPLAEFGMPGTDAVVREACKVLRSRGGCLLARHGVLAVGSSVEQACTRAGYVENAAKICSIAMSNGVVEPIEEATFEAVKEHYGVKFD